jgi:hypothetical protein
MIEYFNLLGSLATCIDYGIKEWGYLNLKDRL